MAALKENLMADRLAGLWASPKVEAKAVHWGVTRAAPMVGYWAASMAVMRAALTVWTTAAAKDLSKAVHLVALRADWTAANWAPSRAALKVCYLDA